METIKWLSNLANVFSLQMLYFIRVLWVLLLLIENLLYQVVSCTGCHGYWEYSPVIIFNYIQIFLLLHIELCLVFMNYHLKKCLIYSVVFIVLPLYYSNIIMLLVWLLLSRSQIYIISIVTNIFNRMVKMLDRL